MSGYADNYSVTDRVEGDKSQIPWAGANRFKISNAIDFNGASVNLRYVDFIKVQSGVHASAGWMGEVSTEVYRFVDLHMDRKE